MIRTVKNRIQSVLSFCAISTPLTYLRAPSENRGWLLLLTRGSVLPSHDGERVVAREFPKSSFNCSTNSLNTYHEAPPLAHACGSVLPSHDREGVIARELANFSFH